MDKKIPVVLPVSGYWRSQVCLRGTDPGKFSDVERFLEMIGGYGQVTNFGILIKPFGGKVFKGISVDAFLKPASVPGGRIVVSAGSDPEYDTWVNIDDLNDLGSFNRKDLILAVLSQLDFSGLGPCDIDISVTSPIGVGASLGTSAAVCVALLRAFLDNTYDSYELAMIALDAELRIAGKPTGNQDHIASSFGSFIEPSQAQKITVRSVTDSTVETLSLGPNCQRIMRNSLAIYFGGHRSTEIHDRLNDKLRRNPIFAKDKLMAMRETSDLMNQAILADDPSLFKQTVRQLFESQIKLSADLVNRASMYIGCELCRKYDGFLSVPGAGGTGGTAIAHFHARRDRDRFAEKLRTLFDYQIYEIALPGDPIIKT